MRERVMMLRRHNCVVVAIVTLMILLFVLPPFSFVRRLFS